MAKTEKRNTDLPMEDRLPGGMTEAMVKGCLVDETDLDHGRVAKMTWGKAIERLIEARGGNLTYQQAYNESVKTAARDWKDVRAEVSEAGLIDEDAVAEAKTAMYEEIDMLDDFDADVPTLPSIFIGMPGTKDYIFDGHAGAGPSGAERWMTCTASLGASRAFLETLTPNQQATFAGGSTAARQGTTAHAAAEAEALFMMGQITEEEFDNTLLELSLLPEGEGEEYNEEMAEWITEYGDLVKSFHEDGHEVLIEQRVEAAIPLMTVDADGDPNVHVISGSADFIALPTEDELVLTVGDLKYGNGLYVEAEDNRQEMIYAIGVLAMLLARGFDIFTLNRIDLIIIQPRLGGTKTWSLTVDELLDWQENVLSPALTEALGGAKAGAAFVPGEVQCQFCPARGSCAALAEQRMESAAELFDAIVEAEVAEGPGSFLETGALDDDRLGSLLHQVQGLIKIADDLKAEAQRRLHRGGQVPGYQLVSYTPPRKWKASAASDLDPEVEPEEGLTQEQAEMLWGPRKLLTPTQALAALKKEGIDSTLLDDMIEVPDKRPVIAPEGDRRKTWEGKPPESMFEDETGDN